MKEILPHLEKTKQEQIEQSIQQDQGKRECAPFCRNTIKNLSVSSLDNYIKCPFVFAAEQIFHLENEPIRDIDIPAPEKGIFVHKLFEIILQPYRSDLKSHVSSDFDKEYLQIKSLERVHSKNVKSESGISEPDHLRKQDILQIIEDIKTKDFKTFKNTSCDMGKRKILAAEKSLDFSGKRTRQKKVV